MSSAPAPAGVRVRIRIPTLVLVHGLLRGFALVSGLGFLPALPAAAEPSSDIDPATLDRWSAPFRGWHYWPDHVVPAHPEIPGHAGFHQTDVPCVYQLPGRPETWFLSFIAFDARG